MGYFKKQLKKYHIFNQVYSAELWYTIASNKIIENTYWVGLPQECLRPNWGGRMFRGKWKETILIGKCVNCTWQKSFKFDTFDWQISRLRHLTEEDCSTHHSRRVPEHKQNYHRILYDSRLFCLNVNRRYRSDLKWSFWICSAVVAMSLSSAWTFWKQLLMRIVERHIFID